MVLFENLLYNDRYVVTDFYNFDDLKICYIMIDML
jgi:hypothetical protein